MPEPKKHVLLVEDEATVALLLRDSLTDLGTEYNIETASSGEEALHKMEEHRWDMLVTDHRMPGITGLELIKAVRDQAPATLTILMTGYNSDEVERAAQHLNVYHYMTKPFPLADLRRVIHDAFALKASEDEPRPHKDKERAALKITLAGDGLVGKTSLIRRLCTGGFEHAPITTIGVDFHLYDFARGQKATRLIVWDLTGQEQLSLTHRAFYRGSRAVGLVYDVSRRQTFERLVEWRKTIRSILPRVPMALTSNKIDLGREVTVEEGQALAAIWGVPFFETSCVDGTGVHAFFSSLVEMAESNQ